MLRDVQRYCGFRWFYETGLIMSDEQHKKADQTSEQEIYLDIWRGAFYSVMLGVVYSFIVPVQQVGLLTLFIVCFVTIYLVSDGITRYNSRTIIRRHFPSFCFFSEVILLVIEMIGLLAFVTWINNVPWKTNGCATAFNSLLEHLSKGNISLGAFCLMNVCHNSFLIWMDRACGFGRF